MKIVSGTLKDLSVAVQGKYKYFLYFLLRYHSVDFNKKGNVNVLRCLFWSI